MNQYNQPRLANYPDHTLEAIERCYHYIDSMDEAAFIEDEKTQDAVIRTFEVMGEASNNIRKHYPDFIQQHADVPFNFAYEMRNVLAHGYFKLDLHILWKTIQTDLNSFYQAVKRLRTELIY